MPLWHDYCLQDIVSSKKRKEGEVMKTRNMMTAIVIWIQLTVLALPSIVTAGEIRGGSIDTEKGSIFLVENLGRDLYLIAGRRTEDIEELRAGRLIIVYPSGRYKEIYRGFRDRAGVSISLPRGYVDKVIYLDRYGRITGGVGMTESEADSLILNYRHTFGRGIQSYNLIKIDMAQKLEAVKRSAEAFRTDLEEEEQILYFRAALSMLAGRVFADAVGDILECSEEYSEVQSVGRSVSGLRALARGVYLVNEGDNGGFDRKELVSEGDNGGFDSKGLVSEGDNGGFDSEGLVSEGDNGGFDSEGLVSESDNGEVDSNILIQGWEIDLEPPPLPEMELNLGGITLLLVQ